ncbi:hypothetical protein [Frigidibacter sp. SD6-1]|uniref:hypothetical protein n=1 Tax=Frigidibacter sp. SD6-1 TaxID=3032581 RepID=UPI0024E02213|nr:hypothetical protein [Frigidibacter sp. SD6-1]
MRAQAEEGIRQTGPIWRRATANPGCSGQAANVRKTWLGCMTRVALMTALRRMSGQLAATRLSLILPPISPSSYVRQAADPKKK